MPRGGVHAAFGLVKTGGEAMPQRHEIQNLVRRGNIFYWRPRVPSRFLSDASGARLSLSLRQSDHRKAAYVARRLNTLLHDLALKATARMTTKDQLAALFTAEIERMRDHLEELEIAARRTGHAADVMQLEADIEVGWAYRLLQIYGTMATLMFDEGCPALARLRTSGIPEAHIANIAATFRSEQVGSRRGVFEKQLAAQMVEVGLKDTPLNRERAMSEIFRAKADVLLDVADRYPAVDREQSSLTRTAPANEKAGGNHPQPVVKDQAEETIAAAIDGAISQPVPSADRESRQPPSPPVPQMIFRDPPLDPDPAVALAAGHTPADPMAPRNLPLSGFQAQCQELIANKGRRWTKDTASDVVVLVGIFQGILEEHGIRHSGEITQAHVAALRQHFNHIPTHYGKSARLRALSTKELRAVAAKQIETAKRTKATQPEVGLSPATIRRHLGNLDHFLKHLRASYFAVPNWSFESLRPPKPSKGEIRFNQVKPTPEQVRPIFTLPVFTGCLGDEMQDLPGSTIFHCANYFLPMLFTYLGARRHEFAGLGVDDIASTENGWAIHIRKNGFRRIKNVQSDRLLPVPEEMIRLGFLDYVEQVRAFGHQALFPELFSPFLEEQDPGDRFYKDFIPLVKKTPGVGDELWQRTIHALRHGLADHLKQSGVELGIIEDLSGRLGDSETDIRYTNTAGLPLLRTKLALYPKITDHLQPAPIRLLRWVQAKEPPPWAGKPRQQRFKRTHSAELSNNSK